MVSTKLSPPAKTSGSNFSQARSRPVLSDLIFILFGQGVQGCIPICAVGSRISYSRDFQNNFASFKFDRSKFVISMAGGINVFM